MKEEFRVYGLLCDAFFIPGILCAAFGGLVFIHNLGFFDIIFYGIMRFISLFKRNPRDVKYETFYDYHVARAEKPRADFIYFLLVGFVFVGISIIFLFVWNNAS